LEQEKREGDTVIAGAMSRSYELELEFGANLEQKAGAESQAKSWS